MKQSFAQQVVFLNPLTIFGGRLPGNDPSENTAQANERRGCLAEQRPRPTFAGNFRVPIWGRPRDPADLAESYLEDHG